MTTNPADELMLANGQPRRIHLIGVAGSGMSGLAGLLLALGHRVSGSDKVDSAEVRRLQREGLVFDCPHRASVVHDADCVIYSSAVKAGNPAFDEAVLLGKPLLRRAEALASLMSARRGILIAGMHGKTTTSAMAAHVLRAGGLHPCHYVGAEIPILGANAHWDPACEYFVAEGDESDGTIALFKPEHAIILNIEEEHLDHYKDLAAIEAVFRQLLENTRGSVIYCIDDVNTSRLCEGRKPAVSFGSSCRADYRFATPETRDFQSRFEVFQRGESLGHATLNVPGRHNVSNAAAVIALAMELGLDFGTVATALESFRGARRRFEFKHRGPRYSLVDDYGHHPSEIRATLETARAGHSGRIVAMFQPHRYTRTQALQEQFGQAFRAADAVVVTNVYAASEPPIPGVSGQTIVDAMTRAGHPNAIYEPDLRQVARRTGALLEPGDCVLSLGAGNIHEAGAKLVADMVVAEALAELLGAEGTLDLYEPLSRHTTLRVGGPARFWAEPSTEGALIRLVRYAGSQNLPVLVMGRGSNLLVRDGGFDGLVIHPNGGDFAKLEVDREMSEITAGVAVGLKRLSGAAAREGIAGFEWMEGIPGAVGGGLRMNAGAMGSETFDQVVRVRVVDGDGGIRDMTPAEMDVHYRDVGLLKTHFAVAATFRGRPGDQAEIEKLLDASASKRKASQPIAASAGCIFKNPSKEWPAGKLVESLGLKNAHVGAARVSEIHGNFIVNDGGASAADVLALIERIKDAAWQQRAIRMETEVQVVGDEY
jgi:UDP-N-acetylmuramate--L-alanine ligase/UDP-N-acetylenolpyruvoylglucosamine reductase